MFRLSLTVANSPVAACSFILCSFLKQGSPFIRHQAKDNQGPPKQLTGVERFQVVSNKTVSFNDAFKGIPE